VPILNRPTSHLSRRLIAIHIRTIAQLLPRLHIPLVLLQLIQNPLIRIRAHHTPQRRVLRHRQLIHSQRALPRIPSLGSIPLSHRLFGIQVVVRGVLVLLVDKGHGCAGPVGAETAGLDAREFDVPFGLYFEGDCFGEAFDGPFGGAVDGEELDGVVSGWGCVWHEGMKIGYSGYVKGCGAPQHRSRRLS